MSAEFSYEGAAIARKDTAEMAAKDDNIGAISSDNVGKAKRDTVGDILEGLFGTNLGGEGLIDGRNGAGRGNIAPFEFLVAVDIHLATWFELIR